MNMKLANLKNILVNSNPNFKNIFNMMQNNITPQQLFENIIQQNPAMSNQLNPLLKMVQGKSPAELQQLCMNLCKERGISVEQLAQSLTGNNLS